MDIQTTIKGNFFLAALIISTISLSGCGAINTMVKKRNLDVQTKMTETIFLEPRKASDHIIYVSVKNTSDKELNIKKRIIAKLKAGGFKLTSNPDKAKYMLQVAILQCGKSDLRSATSAFNTGFGGALAGGALASMSGANSRGIVGAGLFGSIAEVVGNALVDDTYYTMITDLQVKERPRKTSRGKNNWRIYHTRIISTANEVNLKFSKAEPKLESGLIRSISGVFAG